MKLFFPPLVPLIACFYITNITVFAQDFCMGARYRAMGNSGAADSSAWSLWNNPAGMSRIKNIHCFVTDELLYGIPEIRSLAAGALVPVKQKYIIGISFQKQGYQWFNDQQIGIHVANAIGLYSVSGSFLLWQRIAGETYHEIYPLINIGGTVSVNRSLQLGIHFFNISNSQNTEQTLPLQIKLGMMYKLSKETFAYADLVKKLDQTPDLHIGIEYRIHTLFYLRCGMIARPIRMNGGIGLHLKRYIVDYSLSWQEPLGNRHQLSVKVTFNRKK